MQAPHHRKIELQSPADLSYLYTNIVSLSRQKLDLHFPPSASAVADPTSTQNHNQDPDNDPLKSRVRTLVDDFIYKTFLTAAPSISINGLSPAESFKNGSSSSNADGTDDVAGPISFLHAQETIEYEPYDTALAARVAALYAQLESLTTTVAQLRRDAPGRAAGAYAEALRGVMLEDDEDWGEEEGGEGEEQGDVSMLDVGEGEGGEGGDTAQVRCQRRRRREGHSKQDFTLHVPFGSTEGARRRWIEGGVEEVYANVLKTLVRLQDGDADVQAGGDEVEGDSGLAATVGKVERARRAAEVVEHL
ncbi:hypothetical protein PAAG_07901 [Paracoccidioides lutzii Pb01]|uniref:Kinetochore protein mis14 n=1 Tax=Paracoccidioides lutzii (strain ATCC MYA-826 / Pb01) TaxID=502779 RepID=C1HAS2_PARBA|nr:hypothetical protein PAAG_07901 [Paracoccidioides lutzii Pb01]EEH37483.1 hypothetical protein PAAG_07901 [Paracoccidioides lutzii Pb01]